MRAITRISAPLCGLLMLACGNKPSEAKKTPPTEVKHPTPASAPAPVTPPAPVVAPVAAKPIDPKAALHQVYGGDAAQETAIWTTDKAEVSKYPLHYPKLVDFMPDKLEFEVELTKTFQVAGKERTLLVFRAEPEVNDVYYGGALFELSGTEWKPVFVQKVFDTVAQMGGNLVAAWLPLGPEKYAIMIQDYSGGSEGGSTVNSYYEVASDAFRFVASVTISEEEYEKDDEGVKQSIKEVERKVAFLPGPNAAYLDLQTTEELSDNKKKITLYRHNGTEYAEVK